MILVSIFCQFILQIKKNYYKPAKCKHTTFYLSQFTKERKIALFNRKDMSKNFRSTKNLKQIPFHALVETKDDSAVLKLKIRNLQEQIELLKKTNLNIYIPLSQKQQPIKDKENKDEIIRKLRVELLKQQQQSQTLKLTIKKLQKEKQTLKLTYDNEIKCLSQEISKNKQRISELEEDNSQLEQKYNIEKQKRQQVEKDFIEMKVEVRFLKEDLQVFKKKFEETNKSYNDLRSLILQVDFNSKIYKANKIKITAIESSELASLRNCVFELQREIQQLLFRLSHPKKQQKIQLNLQTKNVAEEIVKLKKNIDMQLGLKGDESVIKSFLDKYSQTSQKFKELIDGCKTTSKLSQV